MIQRAGTPHMVFLVWVVGGLLSLAGALSYAELAAALPEAGANTQFLREAYGPDVGISIQLDAKCGSRKADRSPPWPPVSLFICLISTPRLDTVFYSLPFRWGLMGDRSSCANGPAFRHRSHPSAGMAELLRRQLGGNVQVTVTIVKVALIAAIIFSGLALGHAHAPSRPRPPGPGGTPP